mmetsp:Transcript_50816/g.91317  ORF Transcript_50816/g.91317 Transcript_50816/m.91317 type:complete len:639 (-) Transcript_50816:130-2046(-)|eukprot:CAMPEP_0197632102 /NCGR_PEP_ID=MMETSP1338-20131121/9013_1 /TAXON_ID=43686 ORGANISM="Pelagodinium beii, Strain RCC1491" /NCGR_SAMPLE_ID=MMETSP1338 /ASSEMBLY_ACC=CAM_ASM_000754 /LENGTH=638 /DNA_ID=CAMNT_0043203653 /DNA_START=19 /DNA_END=1935 /DNA_ORIENTATION=+
MAQAVGMLIGIFTSRGEAPEPQPCKGDELVSDDSGDGCTGSTSSRNTGTYNDTEPSDNSDKDVAVDSDVSSTRFFKDSLDASKQKQLEQESYEEIRQSQDISKSIGKEACTPDSSAEANGNSGGSEGGSYGTSSHSQARSTMGMLLGLFSSQPVQPVFDEGPEKTPPPSPQLQELRQAVERAEAAGGNSELLEHVRAKLEELEQELERDVKVHVMNGVSGEWAATVRARPGDTASRLREAMLCDSLSDVDLAEDSLSSINFVFGTQMLDESTTLAEAGVRDGDSVSLVRSPLRCLTASFDGTVRLWELNGKESNGLPCACFREEAALAGLGPVLSASVSPGGQKLLTVAAGGEGQLWNVHTGAPVAALDGPAASGQFSPGGNRVLGSSNEDAARIWCTATGKCLRALDGQGGEVQATRFSPDGSLAFTGSNDGAAAVWESRTGKLIANLEGHSDSIKSVEFANDGMMVATASADCTARVWALPSGKCLQIFQGHAKTISSVSFSPDGSRLLTASAYDGTARIWDVVSATCTLIIPGDGKVVNDAVFSPCGQKVLLASASESLRLFDAETGECILTMFGHEDWVRAAAFSPDGTIIASASYDGSARLWSSVTGQCLRTLDGHDGAVISVSFLESQAGKE